ncbi:site-specific integrase [Alteromonas sp. CYL-A6]|uniref:site-specific integrase n=1 Tax=Alteromonas nitratireducens TaxID=3390813 RepID=UPI0034C06A3E
MDNIKRDIRRLVDKVIEVTNTPDKPDWIIETTKRLLSNKYEELTHVNEVLANDAANAQRELLRAQKGLTQLACAIGTGNTNAHNGSENEVVSVLIEEYIQAKRPGWKQRTAVQAISNLRRFGEIIGNDVSSQRITGSTLKHYKNVLLNVPKNVHRLREKALATSPSEVCEWWSNVAVAASGERLQPNGIEKHYSSIRPFLTWLKEHFYTREDYSSYLKKPVSNGTAASRGMYTGKQLNQIFNSYIYSDRLRRGERPKSFHFWGPLIALTTGMRVAEIAALEVQDVKEHQGALCFHLNEKWSSQSLQKSDFTKSKKNQTSIRYVPVPQTLLDAGLLQFIGERKTGLLFNDLPLSKSKGAGDALSKWFNEHFCKHASVDKVNNDGEALVFHSFRHTFISALDKTLLNDTPMRAQESKYVTGHADGSVRSRTYNHDSYNMKYVKSYMDAINFGIDLSDIKYENFLLRKK